jgi:uncharacterized membrane protein
LKNKDQKLVMLAIAGAALYVLSRKGSLGVFGVTMPPGGDWDSRAGRRAIRKMRRAQRRQERQAGMYDDGFIGTSTDTERYAGIGEVY